MKIGRPKQAKKKASKEFKFSENFHKRKNTSCAKKTSRFYLQKKRKLCNLDIRLPRQSSFVSLRCQVKHGGRTPDPWVHHTKASPAHKPSGSARRKANGHTPGLWRPRRRSTAGPLGRHTPPPAAHNPGCRCCSRWRGWAR